jgi:hypothetical protein
LKRSHADVSTTEIYAHYAPDPTGGAMFARKALGGVSTDHGHSSPITAALDRSY